MTPSFEEAVNVIVASCSGTEVGKNCSNDVVEIRFCRKELVTSKAYDINIGSRIQQRVYQVLQSKYQNEMKTQQRSFKRYVFTDLTCDIHNNRDIRVQRQDKHISIPFRGGSSAKSTTNNVSSFGLKPEEDEGEGVGVMTLSSRVRLPVSAFPCRTDMNDVHYVRQNIIIVPVSSQGQNGSVHVVFESICSNMMSPLFVELAADGRETNGNDERRPLMPSSPLNVTHKVSIVFDSNKLGNEQEYAGFCMGLKRIVQTIFSCMKDS